MATAHAEAGHESMHLGVGLTVCEAAGHRTLQDLPCIGETTLEAGGHNSERNQCGKTGRKRECLVVCVTLPPLLVQENLERSRRFQSLSGVQG